MISRIQADRVFCGDFDEDLLPPMVSDDERRNVVQHTLSQLPPTPRPVCPHPLDLIDGLGLSPFDLRSPEDVRANPRPGYVCYHYSRDPREQGTSQLYWLARWLLIQYPESGEADAWLLAADMAIPDAVIPRIRCIPDAEDMQPYAQTWLIRHRLRYAPPAISAERQRSRE